MATTDISETKKTEKANASGVIESSPHSKFPAPPGITVILVFLGLTAGYLVTQWFDSGTPPTYLAYLTADSRIISAEDDLVIQDILVKEGDAVEKGTELYSYSTLRFEVDDAALQKTIADIDRKIAAKNAKAELETSWRERQIDSEIHRENLALADLFRIEFDTKIERTIREQNLRERTPEPRQAIQPDQVFKPAKWVTLSPDDDRLEEIMKYNSVDNALEVLRTKIGLHEDRIAKLRTLREKLAGSIFASQGLVELKQQKKLLTARLNHQPNESKIRIGQAESYGVVRKISSRRGGSYSKGESLVEIVNPDHRFLVLQISRVDLQFFPTGKEVEIDFGELRPFLGKVSADVGPVPSAKSLKDDLLSIVIEPTGKPWPQLSLGTPVHVTPRS